MQPCPSSHQVQLGSILCYLKSRNSGAGTHLLFLVILTVRARLCGNSPGVVHVQREDQGPSLGLLQLPQTKH